MSTTKKKTKVGSGDRRGRGLTASKFLALPDSEKERIYQGIDGKSTEQLLAESKPLTAAQRARWNKVKKHLGGRPRLGEGTEVVAVTVEKQLLRRANAFAKSKGLNRSQLFSQGLRLVMRDNAA